MAEYKNTTYYQGILNKYKDEMEYISEHAGTTFVDMYQVYKLYNVLKQQVSYLMRKIILDTKKKICGSLVPSNRQLFIYSAHQLNVACFLHTLGLYDPPHTPNFGAHVTIEIHRIHNTEYVRVRYFLIKNERKFKFDIFFIKLIFILCFI
ncbi:unnamed protein product [Brassicogethes aeneus]|uniref:Uncharacterized protein n=1 Tax=Brassicogethes aeneus TaxID=1431903 RepID=A0A9P0FF37_BRAAE|nr:unnamed protein product [Brassicogethes aeneus]